MTQTQDIALFALQARITELEEALRPFAKMELYGHWSNLIHESVHHARKVLDHER